MIGTIIFWVAIALVAMLVIKAFTGKNKPVNERSAMEKIACSILVKHRQKMNEVAESTRTVEISREEGIQKCKDAIKQLDLDYKEEIRSSMLRKSEIEDNLPKLKNKPGYHEGKARIAKKDYEKAKDAGKPEALCTALKNNVYLHLDLKDKAMKRIEKSEKFRDELEVSIEIAKATYEGRRATLDDLLAEFESMTTAISAAKFNSSINVIKSLREESVIKLREQRVEVEAQNLISGNEEDSASQIDTSRYEDEFNNL